MVISSQSTAILPSSVEFQNLPKEIMEEIVIYAPSTLPPLMKTHKDIYNKTATFRKAVTDFLQERFNYCSFFPYDHPYKTIDTKWRTVRDNKKAFQTGFLYLVLNMGKEAPLQKILDSSYQIIQNQIKENLVMPAEITKAYSQELSINVPEDKIYFNYLTLLTLHRQQKSIDVELLERLYSHYKSFRKAYEEGTIKEEKDLDEFYLNCAHGSSFFYAVVALHTVPKVPQLELRKIANKLLKIYKLIAIEKGYEEELYSRAGKIRGMLQRIPVNLTTLTQEIPILFNSCEEDIIRLVKERQRIVSQIQNMLRVG